jgi:hypothetical protein
MSNRMNQFALVLMAAISSATVAHAAGGISSNGPVGRQLFNCQGTIQFSPDNMATIYVSLAPVLGQGLVARLVFSQETHLPTQFKKVVPVSNDPRGQSYQGSKIDFLIPAMQPQNRQPGQVAAVLSLPEYSPKTVYLMCNRG